MGFSTLVPDISLARLLALGRSFLALGQALSELDTSPQSLGGKIHHFSEFGIKMSGMIQEHFKEDVFQFGDLVLEYRTNGNSKALLNRRTDMVTEGDTQAKALVKAADKMENLRKKSETSAEFRAASEERNQLKEKADAQQKDYEQFKKAMVQELEFHETQKQADFKYGLDQYVKAQINLESKKLEALTHLLRQLS